MYMYVCYGNVYGTHTYMYQCFVTVTTSIQAIETKRVFKVFRMGAIINKLTAALLA